MLKVVYHQIDFSILQLIIIQYINSVRPSLAKGPRLMTRPIPLVVGPVNYTRLVNQHMESTRI